jgi:LPXTG-motif cell wall-anchored protein
MNKKSNTLVLKFGLVAVSLFALFLSPLQVSAQSVSLGPGQTARFSVAYDNAGEGGENMENVLLSIFVGSELIVDPNSITDEFNGSQEFRVVPTTLRNHNIWGSVIEYLPRSANNPQAPSGTNQAGNAVMPNGQQGILRFNATLREDVLQRYAVGDVLQFDAGEGIYQGILSRLAYNGQTATGATTVTILASDLPASSSSSQAPVVSSSSSSQQPVTPPASQSTNNNNIPPTTNVQSSSVAPVTGVLPRTGGPLIALIVAGFAAIGGGAAYGVSRRRKMKINK